VHQANTRYRKGYFISAVLMPNKILNCAAPIAVSFVLRRSAAFASLSKPARQKILFL